jgi:hypothetical protein
MGATRKAMLCAPMAQCDRKWFLTFFKFLQLFAAFFTRHCSKAELLRAEHCPATVESQNSDQTRGLMHQGRSLMNHPPIKPNQTKSNRKFISVICG